MEYFKTTSYVIFYFFFFPCTVPLAPSRAAKSLWVRAATETDLLSFKLHSLLSEMLCAIITHDIFFLDHDLSICINLLKLFPIYNVNNHVQPKSGIWSDYKILGSGGNNEITTSNICCRFIMCQT